MDNLLSQSFEKPRYSKLKRNQIQILNQSISESRSLGESPLSSNSQSHLSRPCAPHLNSHILLSRHPGHSSQHDLSSLDQSSIQSVVHISCADNLSQSLDGLPDKTILNSGAKASSFESINFEEFQDKKIQSQIFSESQVCKQELVQSNQFSLIQKIACLVTFYWFDDRKILVNTTQGSAFLIDSEHIITARHNFYLPGLGKSQTCSVELRDNENNVSRVEGMPCSEWLENAELDLAMIPLDRKLLTFRSFIPFCEERHLLQLDQHSRIYVAGYSFIYREKKSLPPNSKDRLHVLKASYRGITEYNLEYQARTVSGLSGSPLILQTAQNKLVIVGMHLSRKQDPSPDCRGLIFDHQVIQQINYWKQQLIFSQNLVNLEIQSFQHRMQTELNKLKMALSTKRHRPTQEQILNFYQQIILSDPANHLKYGFVTQKLSAFLVKDKVLEFYATLRQKLDFSSLINQEEEYLRDRDEHVIEIQPNYQREVEEIKASDVDFAREVMKLGDQKLQQSLISLNKGQFNRMQCIYNQTDIKVSTYEELIQEDQGDIFNQGPTYQADNLSSSYQPPDQYNIDNQDSWQSNPKNQSCKLKQSDLKFPCQSSQHNRDSCLLYPESLLQASGHCDRRSHESCISIQQRSLLQIITARPQKKTKSFQYSMPQTKQSISKYYSSHYSNRSAQKSSS